MRKLFTLLSVIFACVVVANAANNANYGWYLGGGGATGADRSADVVTDANGNIFTANTFANTASFNGVAVTGSPKGSGANYDNCLLINKISPSKTTLWTIYSNAGVVTPIAMATTPSGDLIVTGTMRAVVTSPVTYTANIVDAGNNITTFSGLGNSIVQSFVAKFNSSGILQWVKELDSSASKDKVVTASAIAADASGDVYVAGNFGSTVLLPGGTSLTLTNTTTNSFIVKLNAADGSEAWHLNTTIGVIVSEVIPALTYGDDGYLYAAGDFKNAATPVAITIGGVSFTPSIGADLALIKFSTTGSISYIQERASLSASLKAVRVKDIAVKNGKVFVGGSFNGYDGGIQFSSGALTTVSTNTNLNGFVAAFNSTSGADLWQKGVFSPGITDIDGLAVGNDGYLYAFGSYANKPLSGSADVVNFGNSKTIADTPTTNSAADLFLVSYAPTDGTTTELHTVASSATYETANSLANYNGNLYLLGTTNASPVTFENNSTYTTLGTYDIILVNYTTPATGISQVKTGDALFAYADKANHVLVVKQAENVVSARLVDVTGRTLVSTLNTGDLLQINTSGVATGIYILQLTTSDGQVSSQRILVQ
jgi:hypothetical protein